MSRSPLSYPLNRNADTDVGGAADLQTDVMRFMAILSLCLVAIFALVQSIPLTPVEPEPEATPVGGGSPATVAAKAPPTEAVLGGGLPATVGAKAPPTEADLVAAKAPPTEAAVGGGSPATVAAKAPPTEAAVGGGSPATVAAKAPPTEAVVGGGLPATEPVETAVVLTRPKWIPKFQPAQPRKAPATEAAVASPQAPPPPVPEKEGFVLRFASDAALTRAVAAQHVGFYAIHDGRAQRMTVSESRISFWDASTPNTFHEMEATTVPIPVVDALARTGTPVGGVNWGVTLPGKMKSQLDALMQEHRGGSLVIGAAGDIHWESL